jgi:hypothetical protein
MDGLRLTIRIIAAIVQVLLLIGVGGHVIAEAKQRKWRKVGDWALFVGVVESVVGAIVCFAGSEIGPGIGLLIFGGVCFWLIQIDALH